MPENEGNNRPHFILQNNGLSERFITPPRKIEPQPIPDQNRQTHGQSLLGKIQQLTPTFTEAIDRQHQAGMEEGLGLQIEFEGIPDVELAFESLERERSGIELRNVRHEGNRSFATVFVPDGKLNFFEKKISAYLDENKDTKSGPSNSKLLNAISEIRAATLKALWTDTQDALPTDDKELLWWEVWLPVRGDREAVTKQFRKMATDLHFRVAPGALIFPERTVLLIHGSVGQMKKSMMTLNSIAELRRAKETADFFDSLDPNEQVDWVEGLNDRTTFSPAGPDTSYICLLDTGVNNGHPLLMTALVDADKHSVEPGWGVDDVDGHGTEMAGVALHGNLTYALESNDQITIEHRLESVKLIPQDGANGDDPLHHGYITVEAVSRPSINAPNRNRVYSMAVTAKDNRDRGRPSAWSATIDRLAFDADALGEAPKLFVLSAGNIGDPNAWMEYPASNSTDGIHDPAQAWNALTVGAMTDLVRITEANTDQYQPIAEVGGLSPFSTTSQTWQSHWPLKPDVVFEGGNAARDGLGAVPMPSLSLLTTNSQPNERLFSTTNATSAASVLASRMAAQLMSGYPQLKPETIRALMVHSAEWTPAMRQLFFPLNRQPSKTEMYRLVRHCGFGMPNIQRALWSVKNSLTMICEEQLYPFKREPKKPPQLRDMNLHSLPWPLEELEGLGETEVEMRVTLSYFIEPNPSARGVTSRYRYESHGLRFDVKRPLETDQDFRARINAAARNEEERTRVAGDDAGWQIGKQNRHRGSIHSDIWKGRAADLASRGAVAVYPALGWWKTRPILERYDLPVRYSLVISINAPEVEVDLYTAIENQLGIEVEIQ